jgi:hypothetical protein
MQTVDKHNLQGYLNADSAEHAVQTGEYVNMSGFRVGGADGVLSRFGYVESVGGTQEVPNLNLPAGVNICIGHVNDPVNRRIYFFNYNEPPVEDPALPPVHGIYCFDLSSLLIYTVLLSTQTLVEEVTDTSALGAPGSGQTSLQALSFDKHHPIHSAFFQENCLYFTDGLNEPFRINVEAGIAMNHPSFTATSLPFGTTKYIAPLYKATIAWARRQPGQPPVAAKAVDTTKPISFTGEVAMQFAYRYTYIDSEISTLSAKSNLINYNQNTTETYNSVLVTFPPTEVIYQDVNRIDLVVYMVDTLTYFTVKTWTKFKDFALFAAQNSGDNTALSYTFYNDLLGTVLDPTYAAKPYDSVPIYSQTVEAARNRGFMANYTSGYNSPNATSLGFRLGRRTAASTTLSGEWHTVEFNINRSRSTVYSRISVFVLDAAPDGVNAYYKNTTGTVGLPDTVDYTTARPGYASLYDVMKSETQPGEGVTLLGDTATGATATLINFGFLGTFGTRVFKSGASYKMGIEFLDAQGRKCGAVTRDDLVVTIPDRTFDTAPDVTSIVWSLVNQVGAENIDIPLFATRYSVLLSKCLRTRYFQQFRPHRMCYVTQDANGAFVFTTTTYNSSNYGIGIDISSLTSYAQGYVYQPGDLCRLYNPAAGSSTIYNLSVIGQSGVWVILQNANAGFFDPAVIGAQELFEIYTPYRPSASEPFYEMGAIYRVLNPGQPTRKYETTTGTLQGDVYLLQRNDQNAGIFYLAEAMSPNDKFYKRWNTDSGRPNFIDRIGQVQKKSSIAFSNTFIGGSKVNGLSTFDALDSQDISSDYGSIRKLQLTSKIELTGSVMLAICDGSQTASVYLGENVVQTTDGNQLLTQANSVIGYINPLRGSFGTVNPESVVEYKGNVYWYDAQNGGIAQYSDAGLFMVSVYNTSRYWKLFSDRFTNLAPAAVESYGSRPFVFSGIDPHNKELMLSVPKVLPVPPRGSLSDYEENYPFPYDVWDGAGKTMVYKLGTDPNRWQGSYPFEPEQFAYLFDNTYTFKNGVMYLHNIDGNYCNFYGVQYQPSFVILGNADPVHVKTFNGVSVEANETPVRVVTRCFPAGSSRPEQSSDLINTDFRDYEGIVHANLLRDRLTPGYPTADEALMAGDTMRNTVLYLWFIFDASVGIVQVKTVNVTYNLSIGSTQN